MTPAVELNLSRNIPITRNGMMGYGGSYDISSDGGTDLEDIFPDT